MLSAFRVPLSVLVICLTAVGCTTHNYPCCSAPGASSFSTPGTQANISTPAAQASVSIQRPTSALSPQFQPVRMKAVGYGNAHAHSQYTPGQRTLMAMRAAQVDAYRNLAEQVYGFNVWGRTAVSAYATQSDSVRTYVDAFIRGARVVSITSIGEGNFEATVELDISQGFVEAITASSSVSQNATQAASHPGCAGGGCSATSNTYFTR